MTLVGMHPTSPLTNFPTIHSLKAYNGRIYMGYGDYNFSPPVVIASYSPADNTFRLEHSAGSDAIDLLRVVNGKLIAASVDPIHHEDFRDFSYYTPGVGWRDRSPFGALHVYDAAQLGTTEFMAGSRIGSEGITGGGALWRSSDGGRTWLHNVAGANRAYWCFALGSRVWTQAGYFEGASFTTSSTFATYDYLYKATAVTDSIVLAKPGRAPGYANTSSQPLVTFDGSTVRTPTPGGTDFTVDGETLYVLSGNLNRATAITPSSITSTPTGVILPVPTRAIEVLNGVAYAASGSSLYAARLDGTPLIVPPPQVVNEMPDSFGRALAFDGDRLVIGAPDAMNGTIPLSGNVTVWDCSATDPSLWSKAATLAPPAPDFSGWYGKDVAIRDDLLAIVEAGYDSTNDERGYDARVHVYQDKDGTWTPRATLSVPFAHSVAFDENTLLVGTGNRSPSQDAGTPGVSQFKISRDQAQVPTFLSGVQMRPAYYDWDVYYRYKPVSRICLHDDRLIAGFSGDPSRYGGGGLLNLFRKSRTGVTWGSDPQYGGFPYNPEPMRPDRLGFAVAAGDTFVVVGAPRDDTAAPQAGRVIIYNLTSNGYVISTTVDSPVAQAEAGFGSSVAVYGSRILIGAPGVNSGPSDSAGAVYLYAYNGIDAHFIREIPRPSASLAEFGIEVAMNQRWLAAGSRFSADSNRLTDRIAVEPNVIPDGRLKDWFAAFGLSGADADPSADTDADGLSNFTEYVTGLSPISQDVHDCVESDPVPSGLPTVRLDPSGSPITYLITYVAPASDDWVGARVEGGVYIESMGPLKIQPVSSRILGSFVVNTVRYVVSPNYSQFFIRVRYGYP